MKTKFSQDVVPLSDLKVNPGKIVNQAKDSHQPILLTSRRQGVAVVQGLEEYKNIKLERLRKRLAVGMEQVDHEDFAEYCLDDLIAELDGC